MIIYELKNKDTTSRVDVSGGIQECTPTPHPDLEQLYERKQAWAIDCSQCAKHLRLDLKITSKKKVKITFFRVVIAKSNYKRENENSNDCSVTRSVRPVK